MLEKNFEKKFARKKCSYFNKVERKIIFFRFGCATDNKVLDMMKLVSIFFSVQEFMVWISKESITALIRRKFWPLLPEKVLKKSEIGVSHFFVFIHHILEWKKRNSEGFSLVETA